MLRAILKCGCRFRQSPQMWSGAAESKKGLPQTGQRLSFMNLISLRHSGQNMSADCPRIISEHPGHRGGKTTSPMAAKNCLITGISPKASPANFS